MTPFAIIPLAAIIGLSGCVTTQPHLAHDPDCTTRTAVRKLGDQKPLGTWPVECDSRYPAPAPAPNPAPALIVAGTSMLNNTFNNPRPQPQYDAHTAWQINQMYQQSQRDRWLRQFPIGGVR